MLNVRSVLSDEAASSLPVSPGDLTAAARIRRTAVEAFANQGDAASLRRIADAAEVSPALILHHFGSKAGLRAACDAWVLDLVAEKVERGEAASLAVSELSGAPTTYLARMLLDGGDRADGLMDALMRLARQYLRSGGDATAVPMDDEIATALVLVVNGLAPAILRGQIDRLLTTPRAVDSTTSNAPLRRYSAASARLLEGGLHPEGRP